VPRPVKCRFIEGERETLLFKPAGPVRYNMEIVSLTLDEFESIRLADLEGFYQEDAAARMGISRQTFGNILLKARRKIADALYNEKALLIGGGNIIQSNCISLENSRVCTKKRRCCRNIE